MNNEIDILSVVSIILGYQNLIENRAQSAHNDVSKANDKQAEYMLKKLTDMFQEQNRKIDRILELLEVENESN